MNGRSTPSGRRAARALVLVALATAACRFSPQPTPTPEGEIGFLPLTEVASITPPAPPRRACLPVSGQPPLPALDDPAAAAPALLQYLNEGGDPVALVEGEASLDLTKLDFDGDGWVDLAFVLRDMEVAAPQPPGSLLLFHCQQGSFEIAHSSRPLSDRSAPDIHSSEDLNGDGNEDLLVSRQRCGAHTCVAEFQVLLWFQGRIENRFEGQTDDLPSPRVEVQISESGAAEIAITATGINSVGAGPFRPLTRIWSWDRASGRFRPTGEQEHSTDFRIHRLHDADALALEGQPADALALYEHVIVDASLRDWGDPERERRVLSAYARFRQVTSAIQLEDREQAEHYLEFLRSAVQPDGPGAPYLGLAEAFWSAYQLTESLTAACLEAQAYAAAHREGVLDPLYFGYANPDYSPEDVCPLTAEG